MPVDPKEFGKLEGLLEGLINSFKEHKAHMEDTVDKIHVRIDDHMENEEADNDEQNKRIAESNRKHAESNKRLKKLEDNFEEVIIFLNEVKSAKDKVVFFWKNRYYIGFSVLGGIILIASVIMPAIASWVLHLSDGAIDLSILTYAYVSRI